MYIYLNQNNDDIKEIISLKNKLNLKENFLNQKTNEIKLLQQKNQ